MITNKKIILCCFMSLLVFLVILSGSLVGAQEVMKISNTHSQDYSLTKAVDFLAQRVGKYTDGAYEFDSYYNEALGSQTESLEMARLGAVAIVPTSPGFLNEFSPMVDIMNVPYLFRSEKHMWTVLEDEEIMKGIEENIEEAGFKVLTWMPAGARSVYNKEQPINVPEDLDGLKIRVMDSEVQIKTFRALGASPTVMSFAEVYSALQTGVIDGAENNESSIVSTSHYEVSDYLSMTEHMMIPDVIVMSKKVYDGLPEEHKQAFDQAAIDARFYMRGQWDRTTMNAVEFLQENMEINEVESKEPFIEAVSGLHEELDTQFDGLIERIKQVEVNY